MHSLTEELRLLIDRGAQQVICALHRAETADLDDHDLAELLWIASMRRLQIDAAFAIIATTESAGPRVPAWRDVDIALPEVDAIASIPDQEELHRRRYVDLAKTPDGGYAIIGYFDPKNGEILKRALDKIVRSQIERESLRRDAVDRDRRPQRPASSLRRMQLDAGKVGRNELCPCGSGLKHKRCCGR